MGKFGSGIRFALGGAVTALAFCGPAQADVVGDWSRIAVETIKAEQKRPALAARDLATAHIALFEAMNFVEGRYTAHYLVQPPMPSMSAEEVGATAVHHVLSELYPARKDALDAQLRASLETLSGGVNTPARYSGQSLGQIVKVARDSARTRENLFPPNETGKAADSVADAVAWSAAVAGAIQAKSLKPIEAARIYARAAIAVTAAYDESAEIMTQYGIEPPCTTCHVDPAVAQMLASDPATASAVAVASIGNPIGLRGPVSDPSVQRLVREAMGFYRPAR